MRKGVRGSSSSSRGMAGNGIWESKQLYSGGTLLRGVNFASRPKVLFRTPTQATVVTFFFDDSNFPGSK